MLPVLVNFLVIRYHFHLCNHDIFPFFVVASLCAPFGRRIWLHVYDTFYYFTSTIIHPSQIAHFSLSFAWNPTRKCRHVSVPHTSCEGSTLQQTRKKTSYKRDKKVEMSETTGKKDACRNSKTRTLDAGEVEGRFENNFHIFFLVASRVSQIGKKFHVQKFFFSGIEFS